MLFHCKVSLTGRLLVGHPCAAIGRLPRREGGTHGQGDRGFLCLEYLNPIEVCADIAGTHRQPDITIAVAHQLAPAHAAEGDGSAVLIVYCHDTIIDPIVEALEHDESMHAYNHADR